MTSFSASFLSVAAVAAILTLNVPAMASEPVPDPAFDEQVRQALLNNPEIILEVFQLLEAKQQDSKALADQDKIAAVADQLFAGLDRTKPILVEFLDYNCGYCRRAHVTVTELRKQSPDLQVVLLETPILGQASEFASSAAMALKALEGVEAYLQFSDALMSLEGNANEPTVIATLTKLGQNAQDIIAAASTGVGQEDLDRAAQLARALGVSGTPVFVGPGGIMRGVGFLKELDAITKNSKI